MRAKIKIHIHNWECIDQSEADEYQSELESSMSTSYSSCPSTPTTPSTPGSAKSSKEKVRFFLLPWLFNILNAFLALRSQIIYSLSLNVIQVLVPARCLKTDM